MDPQASGALAPFHVSRETAERLQIYVDHLRRWQGMMNLVSPTTLPLIWTRHIADSLQIYDLSPESRIWVDLGSGGGFPGLVTAIRLAECGEGKVILIESDKRKCSFLREVIRATGARAEVRCGRIEKELGEVAQPIDAFSARALAALPVLLAYVSPYLEQGAKAFFLKGKDVVKELTEVSDLSKYSYKIMPSKADAEGSVLEFCIKPGRAAQNG